MTIELTPFTEQHRSTLAGLYLESRSRFFSWQDTSAFNLSDFDGDTEGESIWVACDEGIPLGFVSAWMKEHFIHHLHTHPDHHNRGIGGMLLRHCCDRLGRPASLKCVQRNETALAFYRNRGWAIEAEGMSEDGPYYLMMLAE